MKFAEDFFEDEVREGFYVSGMMKREWAAQIVILEDFDRVCRELGITWYAAYGTLLGAVRHHGFIPWDDDIDVWLKRSDYEKFAANTGMLPGNYIFMEGRIDRNDNLRFIQPFGRIVNTASFMADPDFLKKYQGFPYPSGLDIFVLDRLAPDENAEKLRTDLSQYIWYVLHHLDESPQVLEEQLTNIEKWTNRRIDRSGHIEHQLMVLEEEFNVTFENAGGTELTAMHDWVPAQSYHFPETLFAQTVELPFENITMPVPAGYDRILAGIYGTSYMKPMQFSIHGYPCYGITEQGIEETGAELPYKYYFHEECLNKPVKAERKGRLKQALEQFEKAHREALEIVRKQISDWKSSSVPAGTEKTASEALSRAQKAEMDLRELLLSGYPDEQDIAHLLDEYAETLDGLYQKLKKLKKPEDERHSGQEESDRPDAIQKEADRPGIILKEIRNRIIQHVIEPTEVVFLPFKAESWKYLKPIYEYFSGRSGFHVLVSPIPYYRKNCWFDPEKKAIYEGERISQEVPVTPWECMNLSIHTPDYVVTQNPYDKFGIGFTVDRHFYSGELQKYAGETVYVPWFRTDEVMPEHEAAWQAADNYIDMPGVIRADHVLVPSENMRQVYIEKLTEFAGRNSKPRWERSVQKIDYITELFSDGL